MEEFWKVHEQMSRMQVDIERRTKERKVVRETDILCDHCGEVNLVVEAPGSETPEWLHCPKCDQYHYFIGAVWCTGFHSPNRPSDLEAKLRSALGVP